MPSVILVGKEARRQWLCSNTTFSHSLLTVLFEPYLQFHGPQKHALPSPLNPLKHTSACRQTTSSTATRANYTSVERNDGNMADSGGCCAGGHICRTDSVINPFENQMTGMFFSMSLSLFAVSFSRRRI